ncbi:hypothetical protein XBKB1_1110012 [Xenorhabdus bovienii str. kraussei Becker Underwood]|uniref:Uncharacterized protein n=1 Tax=Xenorhabdus bovienii str. kraussei Becker Underwood TaxID=1398204 RepID=A0A077PD90_XENBV|nr:hypothetical protein XBKB1_1110012 [Xenorhabdus bovienii str. kraussei Becker Underwood]
MDYTFIRLLTGWQFTSFKNLGFTEWNIESIDSIHSLKKLRYLKIFTYCNTPIRVMY